MSISSPHSHPQPLSLSLYLSYWEKEGRVLAADSKYNIVEVEEAIQYKFM